MPVLPYLMSLDITKDELVQAIYADAERIAGRAVRGAGDVRLRLDERLDRLAWTGLVGQTLRALHAMALGYPELRITIKTKGAESDKDIAKLEQQLVVSWLADDGPLARGLVSRMEREGLAMVGTGPRARPDGRSLRPPRRWHGRASGDAADGIGAR